MDHFDARARRELEPFIRVLREVIEPIVAPFSLGWNRSGLHWEEAEYTALFEGVPAKFVQAAPHIDLGYSDGRNDDFDGCVDLWIRYDPQTRTIEATLEGSSVTELLREQGHTDLADALELAAQMEEALRALAEGLRVMLATPKHP